MVEPSDSGTDEVFEFQSYDEPICDGAFQMKNRTPDEIERRVITDRGSESYFKDSVRILTCLHGFLGGEGPTRSATLLVFEYRLHSLKPGHMFTFFYTNFVFENAAGAAEASPQVIAYAPFHRPQTTDPTTAKIKETYSFGGNIGVAVGGPVTGGLQGNIGHDETHLQSGLDDTVWCGLEQNQSEKLGINAVFRATILIEREGSADFVGRSKMDPQGSVTCRTAQLGERVNPFSHRLATDDPINLSPKNSKRAGKFGGLVEESLGSLMADDDGLSLPANFRLDPFLPNEKSEDLKK